GVATSAGPAERTSATPHSAIVESSSARRISSTCARPSAPSTASPQKIGRPISTARAPSASAFSTSAPRRTPPSRYTSTPAPAAAEVPRAAGARRGRHLRQHLQRPARVRQRVAAVVGDHHRVDPVLPAQARVLGGLDALHHDRQRGPAPEPGQVGPPEVLVEL